jgi:hypothetical protein
MRTMLEITDWDVPNHLYLVDSDWRCHAYVKKDAESWLVFKKPLQFDKKYRRFKEIKNFPLPRQFQ